MGTLSSSFPLWLELIHDADEARCQSNFRAPRREAFADRCSAPELEEGRRQCQVTAEEGSCCSEAALEGRGGEEVGDR